MVWEKGAPSNFKDSDNILAMREEERAQLEAELENIQDHIRFTKEHIDELTVKFARFKPPPQLYLQVCNYDFF